MSFRYSFSSLRYSCYAQRDAQGVMQEIKWIKVECCKQHIWNIHLNNHTGFQYSLYLILTLCSFSVEKIPYFISPWFPGPNPKSVLLISLWKMERSLLYARILLIIWLRNGRGAYFNSSSISRSFNERKCVYFFKASYLFLSTAILKTYHQMKGFTCFYVIWGLGLLIPSPSSTINGTILPIAVQPTWVFSYIVPQEKTHCQS